MSLCIFLGVVEFLQGNHESLVKTYLEVWLLGGS
jgi:hypothetical protein